MRYKSKVFDKSLVVRYFMEDEFKKIPHDRLMDVVMEVRGHEKEMISSWEKHFRGEFYGYQLIWKVPHAVTVSTNKDFVRPYTDYRIWVERKAGE